MTGPGKMDVSAELKCIFRKMKTLNKIKCWTKLNSILKQSSFLSFTEDTFLLPLSGEGTHTFLQICILHSLIVPCFGLSYEMSIFPRINDSKLLKIICNCHPYQQHLANFILGFPDSFPLTYFQYVRYSFISKVNLYTSKSEMEHRSHISIKGIYHWKPKGHLLTTGL